MRLSGFTPAYLYARSNFRRGFRTWLALGLLLAVAGGLVVAVGAGAHRAGSAYSRFLKAEQAADGYLFLSDPKVADRVARLPGVSAAASALGLAPGSVDFTPVVLTDSRLGTTFDRFKFLSGRLPRRADEAAVSFTLAESLHLHVGRPFSLRPPGRRSPVAVRIVGIVADAREFPPHAYAAIQALYLAPAFLRTPAGRAWQQASGTIVMVAVRLRGGSAQFSQFLGHVDKIAGEPVGTQTQTESAGPVQRSMHLQALALWLMAGFGGLVVTALLAQLLFRHLSEESAGHDTLRALGMTDAQILLAGLLWLASLALLTAAGAVVVAWLASPLFPLGSARVAEPNPGFSFDPLAIGAGAAGLGLAVAAFGAASAWYLSSRDHRASSQAAGEARPALRAPPGLWRLPVAAAIGIRMATRVGRGPRRVPVRTTIGATAVGIAGVVAAMTFGSSLGHLLSTPALYGTAYDADVEINSNGLTDIRPLVPAIERDPSVTAVAVSLTGIPLRSGRTSFGAETVISVKGSIVPTVVAGRPPRAADEIVLGSSTMAALHTGIGRTIMVSIEGITKPLALRVVGRGVLNRVSDTEGLGQGAVLAPASLARFSSIAPARFPVPPPGDVFVRFRSGLSPATAAADLSRRLGGIEKVNVTTRTQPTDVADFGQVRDLPQILGGLLAALGVATMAYLLVSAIRRRRRDLAVLKTLGFLPHQVSAAIAWQATTVVVLGLAAGIPLGLIAGRAIWTTVAHQIGVVAVTEVPWVLVAAIVLAALVAANVVAAGPAAVAGRIAPNQVLRSE